MTPRQIFSSGRPGGYSLIEVMVVVAIVGILASIAIPSYSSYVLRGKRAEGRATLLDLAARQERFYSDNNQYATVFGVGGVNVSTSSKNNYYTLTITPNDLQNQTYTLTAAPSGFVDSACDSFTLDQAGARGLNVGGAASTDTALINDCWGR